MKKALKISIFLLLLVIGAGLLLALKIESMAATELEKRLRIAGFEAPKIERVFIGRQTIALQNIRLDPDGFSNIGFMGVDLNWSQVWRTQHVNRIVLKDVALTGELSADGVLTLAGFPPSAQNKNKKGFNLADLPAPDISLENLKLDLNTPIGGVRVEGKAQISTTDQGLKLIAALWSKQKQLGFSVDAQATQDTQGQQKLALQIHDLRLDYPPVIATRISGWLDAHINDLTLSGELTAGLIGTDAVKLQKFSAQIAGAWPNIQLSGRADMAVTSSGFKLDGPLSVDLPLTYKQGNVLVQKGGRLSSQNGQLNYAPTPLPGFLQGDDERITTVRTALADLKYDTLDLQLQGPLMGDIQAKLAAKGHNRAAFGDRPVHLNLNIDGPITPAFRSLLNVFGMGTTVMPEGAP